MKVLLIACEFSGTVRDAFIEQGHDAISCDILPTEQPGPHYQGDVRYILNDGWDLRICKNYQIVKGNGYTIYHQVKTDGNCEAKRIREL